MEDAALNAFAVEVDRLLSPDSVMEKILAITEAGGVVLTDAELAALRKVADAEHAISMLTIFIEPERAEMIEALSGKILDYATAASDELYPSTNTVLH